MVEKQNKCNTARIIGTRIKGRVSILKSKLLSKAEQSIGHSLGKARYVHLNNLIILSKFFCPKTFNFFEFTDPKEFLPSAGFCLETTQFDVA
jgi:hypothetical protein